MLPPGVPPALAYLPVLLAVLATAIIAGLWAGLLSQVIGGAAIFLILARPFSSEIAAHQIWPLIAFFLFSNLGLAVLVSLRSGRDNEYLSGQLDLFAEITRDALWEWNIKAGEVRRSGNIDAIFGHSRDLVAPTVNWWLSHLDPKERETVWTSLQDAVNGDAERWDCEYRLRQENGTYINIRDRARIIRDSLGVATRVFGVMSDISREALAKERLIYESSHDSLTGIPNRGLFLERLAVAVADDSGQAVLFIDLDHFKQINDRFGHRVGDQLLVAVSKRIVRHLRSDDMAARLGGDEFATLLERVPEVENALEVARNILEDINRPFFLESLEICVSASIGVAFGRGGSRPALAQQADSAMYQAKRQGRAQSQLFDPALESRTRLRMERERELRRSFRDGSLQLYYQPVVSLADGSLASFEALLRWQHPTLGMILPSEILPIAERADLSVDLGKWVIRQSIERLRDWRANENSDSLVLNFNLSGAEFIRPDLISEIGNLLSETGIPGESLIIELTETIIMESNVDAARRLSQLRDMGIRLALDDFGKGHSSLGRLQDFPISILKIDSSFVMKIGSEKCQILDAIIALAHELELEMTAEGVETREQLAYLKDKGIAKVQGLLFSAALPAEDATKLLRQKPWNLRDYLTPKERSSGFAAG